MIHNDEKMILVFVGNLESGIQSDVEVETFGILLKLLWSDV
jgi:hypothetical protein